MSRDFATAGLPTDMLDRVKRYGAEQSAALSLEIQERPCAGRILILKDGQQRERAGAWQEVPANEDIIMGTVSKMLYAIVRDFGKGKVWILPRLGIAHLINDDGVVVRHDEYSDGFVVRVRTVFTHENLGQWRGDK